MNTLLVEVVMDQQETLLFNRKCVKEAILDLTTKIPSRKLLYYLGGLFQKGEPVENPVFWLSNFVLLHLIVLVPGLLVSTVIQELDNWNRIWILWAFGTESCVFSILASYVITKQILKDIADNVVEKIDNVEDLDTLQHELTESFSLKSILPYSTSSWLAWSVAVILGISLIIGRFVGWGPSMVTITAGVLLGIGFHYLVWSSQIPFHLGKLKYELNFFMPANSELVGNLAAMFNKYLYILAFVFAIFTLEISLMKELVVLSFFPVIGWATITVQFLINRSTIRKIIDAARWRTLNQIQDQMNHLQKSSNLAEKETADALLRLSDIYQRVFSNNVSSLDIKTAASFFSQMMLPLLGLLFANFDRIRALLP